MRYGNVALHGIEEVVAQTDGSVALQRVPEKARTRLEPAAQEKTVNAAGAEIRFVLRGPRARLTLSADGFQEFRPTARVFFGPLAGRPQVFEIGPEPRTIDIEVGDDQRAAYRSIPDDLAEAMPPPARCRSDMRRQHTSSGAPWEERYGYSRALRVGDLVFVAGTEVSGLMLPEHLVEVELDAVVAGDE